MMTCEGHNGYFQIQLLPPKLVLGLETMYETHGQENIASTTIETYDDMETFVVEPCGLKMKLKLCKKRNLC